jgi:hypothetical protein
MIQYLIFLLTNVVILLVGSKNLPNPHLVQEGAPVIENVFWGHSVQKVEPGRE